MTSSGLPWRPKYFLSSWRTSIPGSSHLPISLQLLPANECLSRRAAYGRFDGGDVDLLHRHHRLERPFSRVAAFGKRIGQHLRGDLPADAPLVLAPAALALLPSVADDRVPVTV